MGRLKVGDEIYPIEEFSITYRQKCLTCKGCKKARKCIECKDMGQVTLSAPYWRASPEGKCHRITEERIEVEAVSYVSYASFGIDSFGNATGTPCTSTPSWPKRDVFSSVTSARKEAQKRNKKAKQAVVKLYKAGTYKNDAYDECDDCY